MTNCRGNVKKAVHTSTENDQSLLRKLPIIGRGPDSNP